MPDEGSQQPEGNTTDRILDFISENPGSHLRRIRKELGLAMGTIQYHLDKLEKAGRITTQKQGFHKYYFIIGAFEEKEKQLLEILSNETAREILMFVVEQSNPSQTDISKHVGISSPSVSWHIKRLQDSGIVDEIREGKFKRYKMHGDSRQIIALLKNYYPNTWTKWSNRLAEMFLSLARGEQES